MHAAREEPAPERHEDQILSTAAKEGISNSAMRVFLAGAAGAIGRRLVPLLVRAGHAVTGTTRSAEKANELAGAGITPAVLDVFDRQAVIDSVSSARPEVIIHQLTDLPQQLDQVRISASYPANARIRIEGTRNLLAAARAASARRFIVQSIAFAYAPGREPHPETDPLNLADPIRAVTVKGAADMEQQVLQGEGIVGIVLRYGLLYGPGTWSSAPERKPAVHVDAAAHAAVLAVTRGQPGIYNIAEDDGVVAIEKARAELGFDPQYRLDCDLLR
jgi:nucleoside-diphosphate-sugar epimerase